MPRPPRGHRRRARDRPCPATARAQRARVASRHRRKVRSLIRAVGFLASFVAVVAGCVAFVRWLDAEHFSMLVVLGVSAAIAVVLAGMHKRVNPKAGSLLLRAVYLPLICSVAAVAGYGSTETGTWGNRAAIVVGTAFFALCAAPLAWDLYLKDKASRKVCPGLLRGSQGRGARLPLLRLSMDGRRTPDTGGRGWGRTVGRISPRPPPSLFVTTISVPGLATRYRFCRFYVKKVMGRESFLAPGGAVAAVARRGG